MSDLTKLSSTELQARLTELNVELKRREDEAAEVAHQLRIARNGRILKNKGVLLDLLEHGRSSCSDENPANGYMTRDYPHPRCNKCALIELNEWNLGDVEIELNCNIKLTE